MPLVWDLTAEIKSLVVKNDLRTLNEGWISQGNGHSEEAIADLVEVLSRPTMHYEDILGHLEVQFKRPSNQNLRFDYHGLYGWLVERVSVLLTLRHIGSESYIENGLRYLEGIAGLAQTNSPLWIFSLNHDLIVECIAAQYGIRLDCGFPDSGSLPRRDPTGKVIGRLPIRLLDEARFKSSGFVFENLSEPGINLLKIHGALDVFATNNGLDLIKLDPNGPGVKGVIESLRIANQELLYPVPGAPGGKAWTRNEINYADDNGVMQFLRRTILSGAFKFDQHSNQVLPKEILGHFKQKLNWVSRLVVLGYGGGDVHINTVFRQWLEFNSSRSIVFVGPSITNCPAFLGHVVGQVSTVASTASNYLQQFALNPLTGTEMLIKNFLQERRGQMKRDRGFA